MVAESTGRYRKTQAGQALKQRFGSLEKPKEEETLTSEFRKMIPDIIAGSVFLPEESGLIGSTAGVRVASRVGGKSAISAIERQALIRGLDRGLKAERIAMKTALGKDPKKLKFIADQSLKLRNSADAKYTRLNEKIRKIPKSKVVPEDLELELQKAKDEVEIYGDQYSQARQRINELVDVRADPKKIANEVIPTPKSKIDELVDERAGLENIFKEVFKDEPLLTRDVENTNDINDYNSVIKSKHPELKTYTEVENYNLFEKEYRRNPSNYDEFMNYIRYRDNELLYSAVGVGGRVAKKIIEGRDDDEVQVVEETTRRRLPEGDLGDMDGFTDEPVKEGEPETQPTVEPSVEPSVVPSVEPVVEPIEINYKEQTIQDTDNFDELLSITIQVCKDAYDNTIGEQANYYYFGGVEVPYVFFIARKVLYLGFRGTDSIENILTDLRTADIGPLKNNDNSNILGRHHPFDDLLGEEAGSIEFHLGAIQAVQQLYLECVDNIKRLGESINSIVVCGHSLGGLISQLFTYIYNNSNRDIYDRHPIRHLVTYGQPRGLFNKPDYIRIFENSVPHYHRIWNTLDPVPYVPFKRKMDTVDVKGLTEGSFSGYTHVGSSFNISGNVINSTPNLLLYEIIKQNKDLIKQLLNKYDLETNSRLLKFLVSKEYQELVLTSTYECMSNVEVKDTINQRDLERLALQIQDEFSKMTSYDDKAEVLKPYYLDDIMKNNKLTDDVDETNFGWSCIAGCSLSYNKVTKFAHDLEYYHGFIDELIARQIDEKKPIFEVIDTPSFEIKKEYTFDDLFEDVEGLVYGLDSGSFIEF